MKKIQYGLYFGNRFLTEIVSDEPLNADEVREKAISLHDMCPTVGPEAPFEFRSRLLRSTVRQYN